jgi:hypothetical protein
VPAEGAALWDTMTSDLQNPEMRVFTSLLF